MRLFFAASLLATAAGCATVHDDPAPPHAQVAPTDPHARYGRWPSQPPAPAQLLETDPAGSSQAMNAIEGRGGGGSERGGR